MALSLPPGHVSPDGFLNVLNVYGILGKLIGYRATSVGEWITFMFGLIETRIWGLHASLFGSLYLCGGVLTVLFGSMLFGFLLFTAYRMYLNKQIVIRVLGALIIVRSILGVYIAEPANLGGITNDIVTIIVILIVANVWHQSAAKSVGIYSRSRSSLRATTRNHMR
jgi:hypothetical protein